MMFNFRKTFLFLASSTLVLGLCSGRSLALDNLETSHDLERASAGDVSIVETSFSGNSLATELLSACCPESGHPGTIGFTLATPQKVSICVYDQQGSEIVQLVDRTETSGSHQTLWDGCRKDGKAAQGGTYFLMMKTDESVFLRRMVLNR